MTEKERLATELNAANIKLANICTYYKIAKPALQFIAKILIVKPKWKTAVQVLIATLDTICVTN